MHHPVPAWPTSFLLAACLLAPAAAAAQEGARWFPPALPFSPLLAAPHEVGLRGSFVLADRRASDYVGRNLEAEVALGHRVPVLRVLAEASGRPEVALGLEVGIFSRFFMETSEKDLIGTDFRVGAPLALRSGAWEGRLTVLHMSSHVGDDFLFRFPQPPRKVSRDGVEALLARRFGDLRAYAGADLNFHVNPGVERVAGRAGLEWEPRRESARKFVGPFAAADLQLGSVTDRVAGSLTAGLCFGLGEARIRVEARAHFGPSPMGPLRRKDEEFLGLGLRVEPPWGGR